MSNYYELTLQDLKAEKADDGFANLFGIRGLEKLGCFPFCPQKFARENVKATEMKFGAGVPEGASCKEIDLEIERIQNEMTAIRGKITSGQKNKFWSKALSSLESKMADAKNRRSAANCEEIKEKQEKEAAQRENIKILEETTKSATDPLSEYQQKLQEAKSAKPDYTKYIAIGIAGIFTIGAVFLLLKPSKS
jgi:hypothetical protein